MRTLYSMPVADDVARFVSDAYDIGEVTVCNLLNRGFNDTYEFSTQAGRRFVLRIANRRTRKETNLDYETAFLTYLDGCKVPVAAPVTARDGRHWRLGSFAEGPRPVALFHFLPGRIARHGSPPDAYAQGRTLAEVHRVGQSYAGPASRFQLDFQHLAARPLAALLTLRTIEAAHRDFFAAFVPRLGEQLDAAKSALAWGHCHGDCHGFNARITESGSLGRAAAFFDFDDGGPGWLGYDLAVYLWNKALNPATLNLWPSFLEGYRSVLPLASKDLDATVLFVPIRHIWLLGEYAANASIWGLDHLSTAWLDRQVAFLRNWEEQHLLTRLF
ncbi:MAG TPA: phosphotransferase [Pseudaminobacter sp.]|nr:phosphotransferase [Pseudaminobacter sp.]